MNPKQPKGEPGIFDTIPDSTLFSFEEFVTVITCTNVWYDYRPDEHPKSKWALQDINLTISPGEYVCIVGSNGSGKSTLAKLLKGLLFPTEGSVCVGKYNTLHHHDQWKIRQKVGFVFQNPDHQIVASTVQDDIAFGLENLGLSIQEMKKRIDRVLVDMGLSGLNEKEPHHLSGGQKQRLAIAGVVAMQPETIIFDEATSMLDPQGAKEVLSIMNRLHQQKQTTIISITHKMEEIDQATRIILLAEGRIQLDISKHELIDCFEHFEQWGIELPVYLQLFKHLKADGWPVKTNISDQEELVGELWRLLLTR